MFTSKSRSMTESIFFLKNKLEQYVTDVIETGSLIAVQYLQL